MELKEISSNITPMFFPQREFVLIDNGVKVCQLMAMEVVKGKSLDLAIITIPEYQKMGYASAGLKMLIGWAVEHHYQKVTLTNISGSEAIDKIAKKLNFYKQNNHTWEKSIVGPLNL